ncbi:MAG TPA: TonB-dependent receptor [Pyrinomonadaceae bacterium]|nr:TonB-dependent receptor [Pyrinomonadaceae bacterium]
MPGLSVNAQTTSGTLLGTVRDRSGKALTDTKITLENEENGNLRATRSDDSGNYAIFNLPPGMYKITASRKGFRDQTIKSFPVEFNQKNVVKLPLFTLLTATLNGTVMDSAGNPLPQARVILVGEDRITRETVSDQDGGYTITDLPLGDYTLTALWADGRRELTGTSLVPLSEQTMRFKFASVLSPRRSPGERRSSSAATNASQRSTTATPVAQFRPAVFRAAANNAPASLGSPEPADGVVRPTPTDPGAAAVTRQAPSSQLVADGSNAAALVNTTDAARSNNFTEQQIHSLPVGGTTAMRSFDELTLLLPGVSPPPYTPGIRGPGVGFGIGTAGQFSVNGMRARANNFSVDGSDNNDADVGVRRQGFMALVPQPIESIKEISVSTLLWDAELGRNMGGQVNAVSKYGANQFHGQAYAFFNDSKLNARNFFDTGDKAPFTRAQFGLTFGGPIVRNRTQFFSSFEHEQTRSSATQNFSTPTLNERNLFGPGEQFLATTPTGPFTATTPLGRNVLSLYPVPNNPAGPYGANTFTERLPADGTGNIFSIRLTEQLKPNHSANLRYNFTNDRRVLPSVNGAIRSTLDSHTRSHNVSLIVDSVLGPAAFNQARFSFGRTTLNFLEYPGSPFTFSSTSRETDPALCRTSAPCTSQTGPIGELLIVPFSPVGINAATFPQRRASNTFQYADSLSLTKGKHLIKFGGRCSSLPVKQRPGPPLSSPGSLWRGVAYPDRRAAHSHHRRTARKPGSGLIGLSNNHQRHAKFDHRSALH